MREISLRRGDVADVSAAFEDGRLQTPPDVDVRTDRVVRRAVSRQARDQEFFKQKAREAKAQKLATRAIVREPALSALELAVMPPARWRELAREARVNMPSPASRKMAVELVDQWQKTHGAAVRQAVKA